MSQMYRKPPIEKSLQRIGVLGVMQNNFILLEDSSEIFIKSANNQTNDNLIISKNSHLESLFTWHERISISPSENLNKKPKTEQLNWVFLSLFKIKQQSLTVYLM